MEWIRTHPRDAALVGGVAFFLLIGALVGLLSSGDDSPIAAPSTTAQESDALTTSPPEPSPEGLLAVEPVDCGTLLTSEEIDAALGLDELSAPPGVFMFSRGEVCVHTPDPDEGLFIRTEPGHPDEFEAGATMLGDEGQLVEGVGTSALWFTGPDPESGLEVGVLSVSEETTLGWLYFRIVLGRPGTDEPTRLEAARTLAFAALPRFPGVVAEPELVTFEPQPRDPALASYTANIDAGVERGQWTLGEGLLATLQALTGQTDPDDVLANPDLIQQPAVSVVLKAREFVTSSPDDPIAGEIDLLLARVFPTVESLREQGAIASPTARAPHAVRLLRQVAQEDSDDPEQQEKQEAYCQDVWGTPAPCLVEFPLDELETEYPGKYQLLIPFVSTDWGPSTPMDAAEAMVESARLYESIAPMPRVQVVFTPYPGSAVHVEFPQEDQCQVALGTNAGSGKEFQQRLATAMAYCLIYQALGEAWAEDGLAWYLGARVYDDVNLEHEWADDLANEELSTTILDRWYTNWALFEFIHPFLGNEKEVVALGGGLPESAEDFMHQFYLGLSDANIPDLGGGNIPYSPMAWDLTIGGPVEVPMAGQPYGVTRMHVSVEGGKKACAEYFSSGSVESSWRPGAPGSTGDWSDLPTEFEGESLFVATSTGAASLDMVVTKVVPADKDCEEEGEGGSEPPGGVDPCCTSDHYRDTPPARQGE